MVLQQISRHRNVFARPRLCLPIRRWKGTASTDTKPAVNTKKKYSSTVLLPKTDYPHRVADGKARQELDAKVRSLSCMDHLYEWQREHLKDSPEFVLHDGPPYANGDVHVGHAVNKILKDITNRYKLLRGMRIDYRPGWDCHGLPIELKALERLGSHSSSSPQDVREAAKAIVHECSGNQMRSFSSWGVMANWTKDVYFTTNRSYEAKQIELFWRLYERGLIYRDLKPVYWSPSSQTSLAEAELEYNSAHRSTAIYASFPIRQRPESLKRLLPSSSQDLDWFGVIWTTTPWSIPANQAIAFNPEMRYMLTLATRNGSKAVYIIGEDAMNTVQQDTDIEFLADPVTFSGRELLSVTYRHPLDPLRECRFVPADHVVSDKGTGLVHTAPAHGHDDYLVSLKHGLDNSTCLVDNFGKFSKEAGNGLEGKDVLAEGSEAVLGLLRSSGLLLGQKTLIHSYPYDWRTKKPVILRASEQWFIDVEKIRQSALDALNQLTMIPNSGKDIMEAQLKSRPYWCISRQRTWGVPIPVFYSTYGKPLINLPSTAHIEQLIRQFGADVWWSEKDSKLLPDHIRTSLGLSSSDKVSKGTDILDIWFESGTSWAAVLGENKVADLYLEGNDQYGAWFQTSLLTSVALHNRAPFKKVFVHGFAVDENGKKMSKSIGNVVHPDSVTQRYGVDVLRWWVAQSVNGSTNVSIGSKLLDDIKEQLVKFRNTFRFLLGMHDPHLDLSNETKFSQDMLSLDLYMSLLVREFMTTVTENYQNMEYNKVAQGITNFINRDVSAFYLSVSKDRLYCEASDSDEHWSAQKSLRLILINLLLAIGPIAPHMAEEVFSHLPHLSSNLESSSFFQVGQSLWPSEGRRQGDVEKEKFLASLKTYFPAVLHVRDRVNQISSSKNISQLRLDLQVEGDSLFQFLERLQCADNAKPGCSELHDLFGVSQIHLLPWTQDNETSSQHAGEVSLNGEFCRFRFSVQQSVLAQCGRCRKYNVKENGRELCKRCLDVIGHNWSL